MTYRIAGRPVWGPLSGLGALVASAFSAPAPPKTFFFAFLLEGERLLIDDIRGDLTVALP